MKKVMWTVSVLCLAFTGVALQFMPDVVPMHYGISGEIDRWGSKYENLIFPVMCLAMALFWELLIGYYEKKSLRFGEEREGAEARANVGVLKVTGVATSVLFAAIQAFILYAAYVRADASTADVGVDIVKVSCILLGAMMVVLGNYLPKTRRNHGVGLRVRWSMYNDVTWMKSNRFGGVAMMAAGGLTAITGFLADSAVAVIMLLVYLLAAVAASLVCAYRVYAREREAEK